MRRVLAYTEWLAKHWEGLACERSNTSPELQEGLQSYALEQASAERAFATALQTQWKAVRMRACNYLHSTGIPKDELASVFGLSTTDVPVASSTVDFIHLNCLHSPYDNDDAD